MKGTKKTPALRFPRFDDAWIASKVADATTYVDYRGKTPPKSESGVFLVTAKNVKVGRIDYECSKQYVPKELYDEVMRRGKPRLGDVLITTEAPLGNVATIDRIDVALAQRIIKLRGKEEILSNPFLKQILQSHSFQQLLTEKSTGSTAKGIKGSVLHKLPLWLPSIAEQQEIAAFLSAVDQRIAQLAKRKEVLSKYKKGVMQKIFEQKIRFKDDNGNDFSDWQEKRGKELFRSHSNKNHNADLPILAATQESGMVYRDGIGIKIQSSDDSIGSYKIVEAGDFVISLRSFQGGIEYSPLMGICSPAYTVLKPKVEIDDDFFRHYFKKEDFVTRLSKTVVGIRDGKQISYDAFGGLKLKVPSVPEQRKISSFLSALDEKINLVGQQFEKTKIFKKLLLQQMFV